MVAMAATDDLPIVLCVDDERIILMSLKMELKDRFSDRARIETADSGEDGLAILRQCVDEGDDVALIISDQRMPGMHGDRFLEEAHKLVPGARTILLTGYADIDAVKNAVNKADLYRYIPKPWESEDFALTVAKAIDAHIQARLVIEKQEQIERLTVAMVTALENVNLINDENTGLHIKRVGSYSEFLARKVGKDEIFCRRIGLYASLHDIGKVGVPREILVKPGRYTPEEFEIMKSHVLVAERMLKGADIDEMVRNIALFHHERWDGSGYMRGLAGERIPLEARIVAIADVFDALITERPYKPALPVGDAVDFISNSSGSQFDPELVNLFLAHVDEAIALKARIDGEYALESLGPLPG
ncbi:MAG TPA: HD domain-containing protein [Spirochaetales bacterium]|nr:HD domain-containing protein [Spirochaetales bacterium]